jgi:hypothetical protein
MRADSLHGHSIVSPQELTLATIFITLTYTVPSPDRSSNMSTLLPYSSSSPHELSFNIQRKMSYHPSDEIATYSASKAARSSREPEVTSSNQDREIATAKVVTSLSPFPTHPLPILTCHNCKAQTVQDKRKNRWVRSCGKCSHKADFSAGSWCGCSFSVVERNDWERKQK